MDQPANLTRRSVFTAAATAAGAIGLSTVAGPVAAVPLSARRVTDAEFIRSIEGLSDHGGLAARHALAAGMRPEQMYCAIFGQPGDEPLEWPALLFRTPAGVFTFRPDGRDER